MSSKPGRKRAPLRGEYAEVRNLADALRAIADSRGLAVRDIALRVPYGRTAISASLNGERRPTWAFVTDFLRACTNGDRQAMACYERRVRPMWEAAAPGRASLLVGPAQEALSPVPLSAGQWAGLMKETALALERVSRAQLSAGRNLELIQALTVMLGKLSDATCVLTQERDALRTELSSTTDPAAELRQTRSLLEDTQRRLEAAEQLLTRTAKRLDEALQQRAEAERLKEAAIRQADAAHRRLTVIEEHAASFAEQVRSQSQVNASATTLMGELDQAVTEQVLSRVDDTLEEGAEALDQLRMELSDPAPDAAHGSAGGGPFVHRLKLGSELRRLRMAAGVTPDSAGYHIRASRSKIGRMETGRVRLKLRDVEDLAHLYGVTDPLALASMRALAEQANAPDWWVPYGDVIPDWLEPYLSLEAAAATIRAFEMQFVHGLFQTREYAREVTRLGNSVTSAAEIDRRVELQLSRQGLLTAPSAPRVWVILDESTIRRPVASRAVMRRQLGHLLEVSGLPRVTLQVLPFHSHANTPTRGPFTMLRFADPAIPDTVYIEQLTSAMYLEQRADVEYYLEVMEKLGGKALLPDQTLDLIAKVRQDL